MTANRMDFVRAAGGLVPRGRQAFAKSVPVALAISP